MFCYQVFQVFLSLLHNGTIAPRGMRQQLPSFFVNSCLVFLSVEFHVLGAFCHRSNLASTDSPCSFDLL